MSSKRVHPTVEFGVLWRGSWNPSPGMMSPQSSHLFFLFSYLFFPLSTTLVGFRFSFLHLCYERVRNKSTDKNPESS